MATPEKFTPNTDDLLLNNQKFSANFPDGGLALAPKRHLAIVACMDSRMDSRVVLDEMGADKLLGNGDLLYMAPGTSSLRRAQGTFVSDEEVNRVIEFFGDQQPEYDEELMNLQVATTKGAKGSTEPRDRDDLYDQAVEIVIREGRGSVSLLQRALGVGYGRGARMIDWMAEDGVVGTFNGSQAREVVMSMDEWEDSRETAGARG